MGSIFSVDLSPGKSAEKERVHGHIREACRNLQSGKCGPTEKN